MNRTLRSALNFRMLILFSLGFSSGLPLLLIGGTLKGWMTELGVSLGTVGFFALVQLPYSFKFLWAPLMDRFVPPFLDRRRGWILILQLALGLSLFVLSQMNPAQNLVNASIVCLVIAFFSASQDIAIDAYRRELLKDEEQGWGSSLAVNGYRIGLLLAGGGAFTIAQYASWNAAYSVMAVCMILSMGITLLAPSVTSAQGAPTTIKEAVVEPFREFFQRVGAWEVLLFILLFKIGDQMASDMFNPFYLKMGYEKVQIGAISKAFGLWATIIGGLLGGAILLKVNIYRCLWIFGSLQMVSTFGFSLLALWGTPSLVGLGLVVTVENLSSGMGTAAYVAFMSLLTDRRFTATQYAVLSSIMSIPRTILGSTSGVIADGIGWPLYFAFCGVIAIPGLLMLLRSSHWASLPAFPSIKK